MLLAGWGECLRALLRTVKGIKVGVGEEKMTNLLLHLRQNK